MGNYPGRVALQQRVLPSYRVPFFDLLASSCEDGLSVFAGQPLPGESIPTGRTLQVAQYFPAHNRHIRSPDSTLYRCRQGGIIQWLESWNPDVLIVEANPRYPTTHEAITWMHTRERGVVGWGLGSPPMSGLTGSWRRRERLKLINTLDALISYSRRGAREYQALGFPSERTFVAVNAVAPKPSGAMPVHSPEFDGRPAVLLVGRLQKRKRIDSLLLSCSALPETIQPRVWIVGDGPARVEFQEFAEKIYPQAEFFGERRGAELDELFLAADLFVLPGTGGLAVQQAMTFALPVVVAQGDGTQEDLVRSENGWLVPVGDVGKLTEVLSTAFSDLAQLRSMGTASYRIVLEEVNLETMVETFLNVLRAMSTGKDRL